MTAATMHAMEVIQRPEFGASQTVCGIVCTAGGAYLFTTPSGILVGTLAQVKQVTCPKCCELLKGMRPLSATGFRV